MSARLMNVQSMRISEVSLALYHERDPAKAARHAAGSARFVFYVSAAGKTDRSVVPAPVVTTPPND